MCHSLLSVQGKGILPVGLPKEFSGSILNRSLFEVSYPLKEEVGCKEKHLELVLQHEDCVPGVRRLQGAHCVTFPSPPGISQHWFLP